MQRAIGRLRARASTSGGPSTANMVAWYKKGVGITSAANAVSVWADQTGLGGRNLAQATGAAQPTLQGDGTILWNGSSHTLKTPTFTLGAPFTIYFRIKQVTWANNAYLFDGFTSNLAAVFDQPSTPQISMYAGTQVATNGGLTLNTWLSLAVVFDGASSLIQVNGITTTGNPGAALAVAGLTVGSSGGGTGQFANIQVAEIAAYNVNHDATARAAVLAYMDTL